MKVTQQEIVSLIEGLIESDACMGSISDKQVVMSLEVVNRIKQHGIAPTDVDANGCSTHPKARHGFARQASHSEGEYVCECAGFDPYDAGYQDGILAAWGADGALLPDGMVLVPKEPTAEMIEAAIENGAEGDENITLYITSDYKAMLAAAPEVKP